MNVNEYDSSAIHTLLEKRLQKTSECKNISIGITLIALLVFLVLCTSLWSTISKPEFPYDPSETSIEKSSIYSYGFQISSIPNKGNSSIILAWYFSSGYNVILKSHINNKTYFCKPNCATVGNHILCYVYL